ncbi:hypothetical protein HMPREF1624_08129 [Sporothrix schenckii ATCC 58251]|uniref:Sacsin/Nov domain-containing protein n=1 Tax=Sporothrix schenckii (strain ATCC 58251 / de Perez 2211183) TaxID=1391915 RepID=U7PIZ7_SPOS1|nr:hypothetical protein HMPREF1624_08129 [Sporothrix schenckii ATCC 58251]
MDYTKLRAAALRDGEDEEAVTVDTRALIDKVLARYSGEWTTLRELIQNAADAQATTVKIKWETTPSTSVPLPLHAGAASNPNALLRHTVLHHTLRRLLVENDGQAFTKTDWARLKRIAEGNPDETKIGAFGVGFCSVFADCEEPFVRSGREAMAFYWKGNALFTRKMAVPDDAVAPDQAGKTTFVLDYRNATTALPNLLSVSQFLATSLTFVALQRIEFWVDDWKILDLHKKLSPSVAVSIPRNLDVRTKEGLMTVAGVDRSSAQIDAQYMHAVAWKPSTAATGSASASGSTSGGSNQPGSSKSTDTYGMSAGDMPSLRSFFSRLTGSSSSSSAQKEARNKAAREEKVAQDALLENLTDTGRASIFLRVTSASVKTNVSANFATELERATKKPPPKTTKMAILTSTYDDVLASEEAIKAVGAMTTASAAAAAASSSASAAATATTAPATAKPARLSHKKTPSTAGALPPPPDYTPAIPPADIFASVLPSKKPGGRIFIGFPTMQTTGGGMHVSAPSLIPTVEREAIDLNARWVRNWNMELLRVSGILVRLAFINEMADLAVKFRQFVEANRAANAAPGTVAVNSSVVPVPTAEEVARFVPEALHVLKTYTFSDSTPSAYVGQIIEEAFWTAYALPSLDVFSSRGVLSTAKVRMSNVELSSFVDGIPVVVEQMKDDPFIKKLHDFGIIQDATMDDVKAELESKPLNRDQLVHFLKWTSTQTRKGELSFIDMQKLLTAAVANVVDETTGSSALLELHRIKHFLVGNKIPANLPIPPNTLPLSITNSIPTPQLQALGWSALDILPWVEYLVASRVQLGAECNLTVDPNFAAQVLLVVSKNWDNTSLSSKSSIVSLLQEHTTMPTRTGMRKPEEAFFPSVKLFDDLPVVAPNCQHLKDKFLQQLGVRKTIDLDTIFTRLLSQPTPSVPSTAGTSTAGAAGTSEKAALAAPARKNWSHVELIKYLASVRGDIPSNDINKLRKTAFLPAEAGTDGPGSQLSGATLYRPDQLYEPSAAVRELGFPIVQWPDQPGNYYRKSSAEAQFLTALGLRHHPNASNLVEKMASPSQSLRDKARAYFIEHHQTHGYGTYNVRGTNMAIMPIQVSGGGSSEKQPQEVLVAPSACYQNADAAVLGFPILRKDLQPHAAKFGVYLNPPMDECVKRLLAKPPRSKEDAAVVFKYFATRLADLSGNSLQMLKKGAFVPVVRKSSVTASSAPVPNANGYPDEKKTPAARGQSTQTTIEHVSPESCYLGSSATYGDIFDFVDFGVNGNAFLFRCGSKSEPTKIEIAHLACNEPARLLSTMQTTERYLALLRSLAEELPRLMNDRELLQKMQRAPFLLASREISPSRPNQQNGQGAFSTLFSAQDAANDDGGDDDIDEPPIRQYQLASAANISILDDYISYRLFKDHLMCAPEEDALEAFYLALGAQKLSQVVTEDIRIGAHSPSQAEAVKLRSFVIERSKIFLYEYQKYRHDAIKHDIRWLEKNLAVEMVQSVSLRRSLRHSNETHTEKRSAASARSKGSGFVLYVASKSRVDMYQVGQAICQLVLSRPSQQAYFFFEPFLKLELLDLRARGYNVDRILRQRAAEARIAEEERRKALEAEQERIRADEKEWAERSKLAAAAQSSPDRKMPGGFADDGDSAPVHDFPPSNPQLLHQQQQNAIKKRGIFSGLTRRLGLDNKQDQEHSSDDGGHAEDERSARGGSGSAGAPTTSTQHDSNNNDEGRVTNPAVVQQNMLNAIQATRPFGSNSLYTPPTTNLVKEQATYCDSNHAHDLAMVAQAPRGMNVFLARAVTLPAADFLAQNRSVIATFEALLRDVAAVYDLAPDAVQMYYDATGPTIAFNTRGSIFCNLRYFVQLHARKMQAAGNRDAQQARVDATVWWWVVLAHELAHNLEQSHNAVHSYYTETFVQQYFHKMTARAASWNNAPARDLGAIAGASRLVSANDGGDGGDGDGPSAPAPPSYDQATSTGQRPSNLMD